MNPNSDREDQLRYEQEVNFERWTRWAARQRRTYNAGIAALFAATATALLPTTDAPQPVFGWIAAAVASAAAVGEVVWPLLDRWDKKP